MSRKPLSQARHHLRRSTRRFPTIESLEGRRLMAADLVDVPDEVAAEVAMAKDEFGMQEDQFATLGTSDLDAQHDKDLVPDPVQMECAANELPDMMAGAGQQEPGTNLEGVGSPAAVDQVLGNETGFAATTGDIFALDPNSGSGDKSFELDVEGLGADPHSANLTEGINGVGSLDTDDTLGLAGPDSSQETDPFFGGSSNSAASFGSSMPGQEDAESSGGQSSPIDAVADTAVEKADKVISTVAGAASATATLTPGTPVAAAAGGLSAGLTIGQAIDAAYKLLSGGDSIGEDIADIVHRDTAIKKNDDVSAEPKTGTDGTTAGTQAGLTAPDEAGTDRDAARDRYELDSQGADASDQTTPLTFGLSNPSPVSEGEEYAGSENIRNPVIGVIGPTESAAPVAPSRDLGDRDAAISNPGGGGTTDGEEVLPLRGPNG